jgi:hypothetical protein
MRPGLLSLALCLLSTIASAQLTVTGRVVDPSQAAVPRARVSLTGTATLTTTADEIGRFRFDNVPPGRYRVDVSGGSAFAPLRRDLVISSASQPVTFELALAAIEESVEVNADDVRPSVDTAANLDTTTLSGSALEELPVLDQDFVGALSQYLDPGSVATGGATITVDGVEVKSAGIPKSAVQEIAINDDPYAAEWQRPGRGRIEILTKPGAAHLRASLGLTLRSASLAARSYFAPVKPPERRQAAEGMVGGPVGTRGDTSFLLTFTRQIDDAVASVHAVTAGGSFDQNFATPASRTEVMARLMRDLTPHSRASLQMNWQRDSRVTGAGGVVLPQAASRASSRELDLYFTLSSSLSAERLNQFQLTLEFDREPTLSLSDTPSIIVRDAFVAGGGQNNLLRTEGGGKVSDVMTLSHKKHVIKFGVQVPNMNRRVFEDRTNQGGTFIFNTLADYTARRPYSYTLQQGDGRASFWWREYGAFIQDQLRLSTNLQVAYGIRYDWQSFFHDSNNFSPRASFAWSPHKDGKTVIRGGAGVFYDRSGVAPVASVMLHNGTALRSYTILNPGYPDPFAGGASLADTPSNVTVLASDVQIPSQAQFSLGIERALTKGSAMTLTYRGARGHHLFRSVDVNAPLPPDFTSVPDPRFGHIQQLRSDGRMSTDAIEMTLRAHYTKRLTGQLQYTLGRARNDTGGIFWYPTNQYAPPASEWGPADFDVRHRANLLMTLDNGMWGKVGASARFASAPPYSQTAGIDLFHTALTNARPSGVGRNTLRAGSSSTVDARWSRELARRGKGDNTRSVTVSLDAFNIFNHPNFSGYVGNVRSPFYLTPTGVAPGRRIQLGVEVKLGE